MKKKAKKGRVREIVERPGELTFPSGRVVQTNGADRTSTERWKIVWGHLLPKADPKGTVLDAGSGEHVWEASDYAVVRADNWQAYVNRAGDPPEGTRNVDLNRDPWDFATGEFDGVVSVDVIEHLENIWAYFREAFRVARRFVIVSTPCTDSRLSRAMFLRTGRFWGFVPDEVRLSKHVSPIFIWQLEEAAKRAGWTVDKVIRTNEAFPTGDYIPAELKLLAKKKPTHKSLLVRFVPGDGERG